LIWFSVHPVHVSLTSLDYIAETNNFKGFVRIYLDDFLLDSKKTGYEIDQEKLVAGEKSSVEMLEKYLNEKLVVTVDDKTVKAKLKDVEVALEQNEVNINLSFSNGKNPERVTIKNFIMTELYQDQANMTILKVQDFEQGVKMTPEMTESTFKIK
jgi:hypothetical protein